MPTIANAGLNFISSAADGAVAHILDTDKDFTSGKLFSLRENGTEHIYVDYTGKLFTAAMRIGPSGSGTSAMLQVVDTDGGIAITSTNTAAGTEAYLAGFIKDSGGTYQKLGASAFQWTSNDATAGYASWNIHSSYMVAGVQTDDLWLAGWGNHGAAFFPADLTSGSAPGASTLRINGAFEVTSTTTLSEALSVSKSADAVTSLVSILNANAGTSAAARFRIGNNASASAFTVDVYGGNHASLPNVVRLLNQLNGDLELGGYGATGLTLGNGTATFSATVDINSGTIDGVVIGGASAAAGSFTTLSASGVLDLGIYATGSYGVRLRGNDQSNARIRLENVGTGGNSWELVAGLTGANNSAFSLYDQTGATTVQTWTATGTTVGGTLSVTGTSTLTGNVGVGGAADGTAKILTYGSAANADVLGLLVQNTASTGAVDTVSIAFASAGASAAIKARIKAAVYGDGYMDFNVNTDTPSMRLSANGGLHVGTTLTSPAMGCIVAEGNLSVSGTSTLTGQVGITPTLTAGTYAFYVNGAAGAARNILLAGQAGFSNGFTVDYDGSAMQYQFRDGTLSISGANGSTVFDNSTYASTLSIVGDIAGNFDINNTDAAGYVRLYGELGIILRTTTFFASTANVGSNSVYWEKAGTRSWTAKANQTTGAFELASGDSAGEITLTANSVTTAGALTAGQFVSGSNGIAAIYLSATTGTPGISWSDVTLARGAANRLDLGSGDSLQLSGGGSVSSAAWDNGAGAGTFFYLQRNSNASTPASGYLGIQNKNASARYIWPDGSGLIRTHTAAPTNANDTAGTVVGDQTSDVSIKNVLGYYDDYNTLLKKILDVRLDTYTFKEDSRRVDKTMIGPVIYEENRNDWWVMNGGQNALASLDQAALWGAAIGAIKAINNREDRLEKALRTLIAQNEDLVGREEALKELEN